MMLKLDRDQIAAELAALDALLDSLPANDHLGRIGFMARRKEISDKFASLAKRSDHRASLALYFGGDPVIGSLGIEAGFSTNALGSFQDLLSKVWGEAETGGLSPAGPVKDKPESQLHITSLVHGSFGFLLEELDEHGEPLFETSLKKAADQIAGYMAKFAGEDEQEFTETIEQMDPRVFLSLREFFGYIYRGKATFRLVEGDRDERFDRPSVERAWHRAEESSVEEKRIRVEGRLLGVIPVRRRFEFERDGAHDVIEGAVGEKFGQSYLERISTEQFAGRRWAALLHRKVVSRVRRQPSVIYTLLELEELDPAPADKPHKQ
ncbi:MAG: hypothetical protein ABR923_21105 [Terracidiphilus sp.]|jgi:hypothetical protein